MTGAQIQLLRSRLMDLRSCLLLPADSTSLYVGDDLACGFCKQLILLYGIVRVLIQLLT